MLKEEKLLFRSLLHGSGTLRKAWYDDKSYSFPINLTIWQRWTHLTSNAFMSICRYGKAKSFLKNVPPNSTSRVGIGSRYKKSEISQCQRESLQEQIYVSGKLLRMCLLSILSGVDFEVHSHKKVCLKNKSTKGDVVIIPSVDAISSRMW